MKVIKTYEQMMEGKNPCWPGYKQIGTKKKAGKTVPNCVPVAEEAKAMKATETLETFSSNRLAGASKIAQGAKEKGGDALLTYHHFKVKLPYYKQGVEGDLDFMQIESEYKGKLNKLYKATKNSMNIEQIAFQELVGEIEVLGELLIRENTVD
jgi:hypothetical protein